MIFQNHFKQIELKFKRQLECHRNVAIGLLENKTPRESHEAFCYFTDYLLLQ